MKKKHILVVSQYFYPEPFRINDMCMEWVKRGYEVTVLTGIPNYPQGKFYPGYGWFRKRKESWNGVNIIRIPIIARGSNALCMILNYISFVISGFWWEKFTRLKADYVFIFEVSPMTQALIGIWYSKRNKIPCYLYVQDLWPENVEIVTGIHSRAMLAPISGMVNYIYKHSDVILATSKSFVAEIQKRLMDNKHKVRYWPQYAEEFYRPEERRSVPDIPNDGSFKVIFTGNIGRAQGLEILPKVAARLKTRKYTLNNVLEISGKTLKFIIVGDGRYKDTFIKQVREAGVEDMFVMIPRQPASRIPELLACCDAAFLSFMDNPLFAKTIPAKLQSYMACGMPVIASATGETERIINEADCGICCRIGDVESLADGLERLIITAKLAKMSMNSKKYCDEYFNKKLLMDQINMLFLEEKQA